MRQVRIHGPEDVPMDEVPHLTIRGSMEYPEVFPAAMQAIRDRNGAKVLVSADAR